MTTHYGSVLSKTTRRAWPIHSTLRLLQLLATCIVSKGNIRTKDLLTASMAPRDKACDKLIFPIEGSKMVELPRVWWSLSSHQWNPSHIFSGS